MASKTEGSPHHQEKEQTRSEECLEWIKQRKAEVDNADYGVNRLSMEESIAKHREKAKAIDDFKNEVDLEVQSDQQNTTLLNDYADLKELSDQKLKCLETLLGVASLDENCTVASNEFDKAAVALSDAYKKVIMEGDVGAVGKNTPGDLSTSAQVCVLAMMKSWGWIENMVGCVAVHLKNASSYHQFFHEVAESQQYFVRDLDHCQEVFAVDPVNGDYDESQKLLKEIKDVSKHVRKWELKVNEIWDQSIRLVPVHMRTQTISDPIPARSLCNYQTTQIKLNEGEDIELLDNSKVNLWKVRNQRGDEGDVPPTCILIPGPFSEATQAAIRLRFQLLTAWTNTLKTVGKRIINLMLLVFKSSYTDEEIETLKALSASDKNDLILVLDSIENILTPQWKAYKGFVTLQERMPGFRMALEEPTDDEEDDVTEAENDRDSFVAQIKVLGDLMNEYKELWKSWETFKIILEMSKYPELLVVKKWEELKYVSVENCANTWHTELALEDEEAEDVVFTEDTTEFGYGIEKKTAIGEPVSQSEIEEQSTFTIRSVTNPRTDSEISFSEAKKLGIIDDEKGLYCNLETGTSIPIPEAMSQGLINVQATSRKQSEPIDKSYGIITVKLTGKPVALYDITRVKDAEGKMISQTEALERGVLDDRFYYAKSNGKILIAEAIEKKLIDGKYHGMAPKPQIETRSYAVREAVDTKLKKRVPFLDAVDSGIIDKESCTFRDTLTGNTMMADIAIMRGYLKVIPVDDPNKMDIDPTNKMVIDKTEAIKKNVVKPLGVIGALKRAVRTSKSAEN